MSQSLLEYVLWILLVFFIGCMLGYILRRVFAGSSVRQDSRAAHPAPAAAAASFPEASSARASLGAAVPDPVIPASPVAPPLEVRKPKAEPARQAPVKARAQPPKTQAPKSAVPEPESSPGRPKGIAAPRGGSPDKLQRISGVGPKIELILHRLGIFHFDQIAEWTPEQEQWIDDHLKFKGRIARDGWVRQAKLLARGKEEDVAGLSGKESASEKKPARTKANSRTHQR
jgi:predicted flap endonuclease-1-like 5' DNA nuclease